MVELSDLPPEILIRIFCNLPVKDILSLACTCLKFKDISTDNFVWEEKIYQDYRLKTKKCPDAEGDLSPQNFYRFILHKYGKHLGLWKSATSGHYSALFQVIKRDYFVRVKFRF